MRYEDGNCCEPDSGQCCGPGSWCCARAGKHQHDDQVTLDAVAVVATGIGVCDITSNIHVGCAHMAIRPRVADGPGRVEIGYVCRHGHFQFINDPDGDACGTKRVATIYATADEEVTPDELTEAVGYSLESHHRKMEEWRAK